MSHRDQQLVQRIRAGDEEGWQELWDHYERRVFRFALRRLRDPCDAEDVRQDVFVEVIRSLESFEGRSSLSTWILGIADHEVASRYRQRGRRPLSLDDLEAPEPAAPGPALERALDAARILARCAEVVRRESSDAQRAIFELHAYGGRSAGVLARSLGRSAQAVRISLFRTRQRLLSRVAGLAELLSA